MAKEKKEKKKIFLLFGVERYLVDRKKRELLQQYAPEQSVFDTLRIEGTGVSLSEVQGFLDTYPILADYRVLLLEDTGLFSNGSGEKLIPLLENLSETAVLIFSERNLNRSYRLFRLVKEIGNVFDFQPLVQKELVRWVQEQVAQEAFHMEPETVSRFIDLNGSSMYALENELKKLFSYRIEERTIQMADVELLATPLLENRIFDLIRAMGERDRKKTLRLYFDLLQLKEAPLKILALLARQFGQLLIIRQGMEEEKPLDVLAAEAGVSTYVASGLEKMAARFSVECLKAAREDCAEMDLAIKSGQIKDTTAVEILLCSYS